MLFSSPVYSKASGSVAGLTYSHNKGGMYARARVTPTDPATGRQIVIRGLMTSLANTWSNTLSAIQRAAWALYGANVAMTNRIGETIYLSGQQHFIRCNVPRLQGGIAVIIAAPTNFNLGEFTPPGLTSVNDSDDWTVTFDNTDDWASTDGGYLLLYGGKPVAPSINFFKGPFRYADKITGATTVPPTSPAEIAGNYTPNAGNHVWGQFRIIQVDGRLSGTFLLGPVVVIEDV